MHEPLNQNYDQLLYDPLVLKIVSIGFGLMFLLAAVHKLSGLQQFRATLTAYELMPAGMAAAAAVAIAST